MTLSANARTALIDISKVSTSRATVTEQPHADQNIAALLAAWRQTQRPVIHVQHMSTNPDSPLRPTCRQRVSSQRLPQPGRPVFQKTVNAHSSGRRSKRTYALRRSIPSPSWVSRPSLRLYNHAYGGAPRFTAILSPTARYVLAYGPGRRTP